MAGENVRIHATWVLYRGFTAIRHCPQETLAPKKLWPPRNFGPQETLAPKKLWPPRNFGPQETLAPKKLWPPRNFGPQETLAPKKLWPPRNFGPQETLAPKKLWPPRNFGPQETLAPKKLWPPRNFGPQETLAPKKLCSVHGGQSHAWSLIDGLRRPCSAADPSRCRYAIDGDASHVCMRQRRGPMQQYPDFFAR